MSGGLRRWVRLAGWPGIIGALMSVFTLVGLSLLYRELPVTEAGLLALVISLSDILSLVALLGIGTTITRLYGAAGPGAYDWPADLAGTFAYAFPVVILGTAMLSAVYGFTMTLGITLLGLTALGVLLTAAYSMLNSQGRYTWSAFLVRAPNASLLLPGLASLAAPFPLRLSEVLLIYLIATLVVLLLAVVLLRRFLRRGRLRTTRTQRLEGVAFMATAATDLLPDQGLIAAAARILPLDQVAAFAAVALLLRPFRLLRSLLAMILGPDLLRFRRASYTQLLTGVWVLALGCGLASAIFVPPLARWFYQGRYQVALSWIPYLSLAGTLLVAVVPPRVDFVVRSPISGVRGFALAYFAAMLGSLAMCIAGMAAWGAVFLAVAVVLLELTETGVTYSFWLAFRRREAQLPAS